MSEIVIDSVSDLNDNRNLAHTPIGITDSVRFLKDVVSVDGEAVIVIDSVIEARNGDSIYDTS